MGGPSWVLMSPVLLGVVQQVSSLWNPGDSPNMDLISILNGDFLSNSVPFFFFQNFFSWAHEGVTHICDHLFLGL